MLTMHLLNTHKLQIKDFNHRDDDFPSYAILSHLWGGHEQSFQDITKIIEANALDPTIRAKNSWRRVSSKITRFCRLAAELGYDWGWVDTCCINKESSAELSEAINSMFEWYSKADLCIAYMEDVGHPSAIAVNNGSSFRYSRWFTRGWTLQELIAPRAVMFVANDWEIIGTKATLSRLVSVASGIPIDVLTTPGAIARTSSLQRLLWTRERETTRVEDRAYSLMGLFGVNMPTIYGEGENAFRRLQEEILKISSDQTLFAWGVCVIDSLGDDMETGDWPPGLLAPSFLPFQQWGSYYGSPEPLPVEQYPDAVDRKSTRLNSSHSGESRMPSSA